MPGPGRAGAWAVPTLPSRVRRGGASLSRRVSVRVRDAARCARGVGPRTARHRQRSAPRQRTARTRTARDTCDCEVTGVCSCVCTPPPLPGGPAFWLPPCTAVCVKQERNMNESNSKCTQAMVFISLYVYVTCVMTICLRAPRPSRTRVTPHPQLTAAASARARARTHTPTSTIRSAPRITTTLCLPTEGPPRATSCPQCAPGPATTCRPVTLTA